MRTIINIDVPELAPAIKFYCAALAVELSRIIDGDVAELVGASSVIYLLENPAGSASTGSDEKLRNYSRHWTPVHIDFVVDDVIKAADQAVAAGAIKESECVEWRGSQCITLADPFGHGFCFIEFAGDTYRA